MYQYYVVEVQTYADGSYGHLVHWAADEDADKARMKGEAKYHQVLAAAAVSELPCHSAILFTTEGFPVLNQCYKHPIAPQPESEPEQEPEEEEAPEEPGDVNSLFS